MLFFKKNVKKKMSNKHSLEPYDLEFVDNDDDDQDAVDSSSTQIKKSFKKQKVEGFDKYVQNRDAAFDNLQYMVYPINIDKDVFDIVHFNKGILENIEYNYSEYTQMWFCKENDIVDAIKFVQSLIKHANREPYSDFPYITPVQNQFDHFLLKTNSSLFDKYIIKEKPTKDQINTAPKNLTPRSIYFQRLVDLAVFLESNTFEVIHNVSILPGFIQIKILGNLIDSKTSFVNFSIFSPTIQEHFKNILLPRILNQTKSLTDFYNPWLQQLKKNIFEHFDPKKNLISKMSKIIFNPVSTTSIFYASGYFDHLILQKLIESNKNINEWCTKWANLCSNGVLEYTLEVLESFGEGEYKNFLSSKDKDNIEKSEDSIEKIGQLYRIYCDLPKNTGGEKKDFEPIFVFAEDFLNFEAQNERIMCYNITGFIAENLAQQKKKNQDKSLDSIINSSKFIKHLDSEIKVTGFLTMPRISRFLDIMYYNNIVYCNNSEPVIPQNRIDALYPIKNKWQFV